MYKTNTIPGLEIVTDTVALVRPNLGYATQIWAPQSIELIVKLERTQRLAT